MHTRRMKCARNNLHGVFMRPVAPDIGNIPAFVLSIACHAKSDLSSSGAAWLR